MGLSIIGKKGGFAFKAQILNEKQIHRVYPESCLSFPASYLRSAVDIPSIFGIFKSRALRKKYLVLCCVFVRPRAPECLLDFLNASVDK